jgi:hypothetical protein
VEREEAPHLFDAIFDLGWAYMSAPRQPSVETNASGPRSIACFPSRYSKRGS